MILREYGAESTADLSGQDIMSIYRTVSDWFYKTLKRI